MKKELNDLWQKKYEKDAEATLHVEGMKLTVEPMKKWVLGLQEHMAKGPHFNGACDNTSIILEELIDVYDRSIGNVPISWSMTFSAIITIFIKYPFMDDILVSAISEVIKMADSQEEQLLKVMTLLGGAKKADMSVRMEDFTDKKEEIVDAKVVSQEVN